MTMMLNLMDTLPEDVLDKIYRRKHELEFRRVVMNLNCLSKCPRCFCRVCPLYMYCSDCAEYLNDHLFSPMSYDSDETDDSDNESEWSEPVLRMPELTESEIDWDLVVLRTPRLTE